MGVGEEKTGAGGHLLSGTARRYEMFIERETPPWKLQEEVDVISLLIVVARKV